MILDKIARLADVQRIKNHGLEKRPTDDSQVFVVQAPKLSAPVIVVYGDDRAFIWTADGRWRMYTRALAENFTKLDIGLGATMALIAGNNGIDSEPVGHLGTLNRLKSWIYDTFARDVAKVKATGSPVSRLSDLVGDKK